MSRSFWAVTSIAGGAAAAVMSSTSGPVGVMIVAWLALGVLIIGLIDIWIDPTNTNTTPRNP